MHAKKFAVAAVSAAALSLAGWVGPASAAPTASCDKYPPVHCTTDFGQSHYHRGDRAHFQTDNAFFRHELVHTLLRCHRHHYHNHLRHFRAHHHHVHGAITIPKHAPFGHCTLTLTGVNSGNKASGSFRITRG